jgi:hypothetical protein
MQPHVDACSDVVEQVPHGHHSLEVVIAQHKGVRGHSRTRPLVQLQQTRKHTQQAEAGVMCGSGYKRARCTFTAAVCWLPQHAASPRTGQSLAAAASCFSFFQPLPSVAVATGGWLSTNGTTSSSNSCCTCGWNAGRVDEA